MAGSEVTPNLGGIRDRVADRIRTDFVDLIPPEEWAALVRSEITAFIGSPEARWGEGRKPSPLQAMIQDELKKRFLDDVRAYLFSPEFNATYDGALQKNTPSQAVTEILKGITPNLVAALFGDVTQQIVMQLRNGLSSGR